MQPSGLAKKPPTFPTSRLVSGVGLNFYNDDSQENFLRVKSILKGGSAEKQPQIAVGDFVLAVNGADVQKMPASDLRNLLRGEIGKPVQITFRSSMREGDATRIYEVQLIRGYAENALQEEKSRFQQAIEDSRKRLTHCKVEEQTLISNKSHLNQLGQMNAEQIRNMTNKNNSILEQIKLRASAIEELRTRQDQDGISDEEAELQARIASYEAERAELTKQLSEAEIKIVEAVGQLDSFQTSTLELDQLCKSEQIKRENVEKSITAKKEGASLRQGVLVSREQRKKDLQEKVEHLQATIEGFQQQRQEQEKYRENAHLEEVAAQEVFDKAQKQNQEVQFSIREAERMLRKSEGERLEALSKYDALTLEFGRCKNQIQVREQKILDLQGRIEDYYGNWNSALTNAQNQRKQDQERYLVIEEEKQASLRKLMEERQALAAKVMEDSRLNELRKNKEDFEARLANQRTLNVKLTEEKTSKEDQIKRLELQCSRHEIQVLQSNQIRMQRTVEHECNLSNQKFQALNAEKERQMQKDQVREDFAKQMQDEHLQETAAVQKQIEELEQNKFEGIEAMHKVDEEVQKCADALKQLREVEATRMRRIETFSRERQKLVNSFNDLLGMEEEFRRNLEGARQPVAQAANFYHRHIAAVAESFSFTSFGLGDVSPAVGSNGSSQEPAPPAFPSFSSEFPVRAQLERASAPTRSSQIEASRPSNMPLATSMGARTPVHGGFPILRSQPLAGSAAFHFERSAPVERMYVDARDFDPVAREPREYITTVREYRPNEINPSIRYETMA